MTTKGTPSNKRTAQRHPGGRPTKMSPEVIEKLQSIFRIDGTIAEACGYANIDVSTYHNRCNQSKEFLDKMATAQDYPFILARKTIMKGMQDGDNKCAMEYLKRRDRRYADKSEHTHNGNISLNPLGDKLSQLELESE